MQDFSSIAELDAMFAELVSEENIPGMAVAIVAHGEVVWSGGYGFANVQAQKPVTPDTPFLLASISKLFTGAGVMKAWEHGQLSLDDNINDYLSFSVDNPHLNNEVITPRHLVTHVLMPGMDGFEVCRQLKADETTRAIPVIFMTALATAEDKVRGCRTPDFLGR